MSDFTLAAEFPKASEEEWLRRIADTLRGRPFDSLMSDTLDSIRIKPLYRGETAPAPILRHPRLEGERPWRIMQRADMPDLTRANRQILEDLENGADGMVIVLPGAVTAGSHGMPLSSVDDLKRLTEGIQLDLISVRLDGGRHGLRAGNLLLAFYESRRLDLARCELVFGLDPLGVFALTGRMGAETETAADLAAFLKRTAARRDSGAAILADTRVYHGAGCSEAQEIALALATAVQYLRWLEAEGLDVAGAAGQIGFLLTADTDQFLTIAKLRAARLIWARAEAAIGLNPRPLIIHVETSMRVMSRRDPHVNLLRTAAAAFAAGIGGADAVTNLPFTAALGLPDGFARRLARNIQTILQEESGVGAVAEAGAGAGYVEAMTTELAGKAWQFFQAIEAQGGMLQALLSGFVQAAIAEVASNRERQVAVRRYGLTGVSEYPTFSEASVTVLDLPRSEVSHVTAEMKSAELSGPALKQSRLAEPFERLRDAADAHAGRTGRRPAVFLANLGRLSDFNARATWVRNLLAAGGIAASGEDGFSSGEAAAQALESSGADVACICSSEQLYDALAVDVAQSLKAAGAIRVYLAGRPGERQSELQAAGIDEFLFSGMDIVHALERLHKALGVNRSGVDVLG